MSAPGDERARATTALARIRGVHTVGVGPSDDEIAREFRFRDAVELIAVLLEEKMPAPQLVALLETFLLDPERTALEVGRSVVSIAAMIESELRKAIDGGEPWVMPRRTINGPISNLLAEFLVEPRGAIEWFLASRRRASFIAPVFLKALGNSASPMIGTRRAITGPKPGMQGSPKDHAYNTARAILTAGETPTTKRALARMVKDRLDLPHKLDTVERWLSDLDPQRERTKKKA